MTCGSCGSELAPGLLACPSCHALVHSAKLSALAVAAEASNRNGDCAGALVTWREAIALLPSGTRQYDQIAARIAELTAKADAPPPPAKSGWAKGASGAGALGLILWKMKWLVAFILGQGKLLLVGLTKSSTFFSMLLSLGVYWSMWGWRFAAGLIASMYVHEMGHIAQLRRYGMPTTAPMFVPGLGAFIRLKQTPVNPGEDARIGLAGPTWGLVAALVAAAIGFFGDSPAFLAIARAGGWLNLFNLLPLGQLDGGRGFRALTQQQRWLAVGALGIAWFFSQESLLLLLIVVGIGRAFSAQAPKEGDREALLRYVVLLFALAALCKIPVPTPATG